MKNIRSWIVTAGAVVVLDGLGVGVAAASQGADDSTARVVPASSTTTTPAPHVADDRGGLSDRAARTDVGDNRGGSRTEPGDDHDGARHDDDPAGHR